MYCTHLCIKSTEVNFCIAYMYFIKISTYKYSQTQEFLELVYNIHSIDLQYPFLCLVHCRWSCDFVFFIPSVATLCEPTCT